ncbi:helix-turn-helix domain-containing protein [Vreelandella alkaliphila]|uniref:helix-turn-helix domain-containing protein n=1 Tax=Vreelandella alkaliphila TaxID=272774 RepID=UPI003FD7D6DA
MSNDVFKKNIAHLASVHGSQEKLAKKIDIDGIDQRRLSYIINGRKSMVSDVIREMEERLLIPAGWLDRYELEGRSNTLILKKYRKFNEEIRDAFDEISLHMISMEKNDKDKLP